MRQRLVSRIEPFYLNEVAAAFHGLQIKEMKTYRFVLITDNTELSKARLALVRAAALVIASGLM